MKTAIMALCWVFGLVIIMAAANMEKDADIITTGLAGAAIFGLCPVVGHFWR